MNYIIHLTDSCNLNCKYCYEKKEKKDISFENIQKLIDYEIKQKNKHSTITFYGGEPLTKIDLIHKTIEYINKQKTKTKFYYGITTNATLINEEIIKFMKENNFINIAYSIDGNEDVHNLNRKFVSGDNTFDIVEKNAKKVLEHFKDAVAMVAVTKNNIENLDESVKYLIDLGFTSINILFDYTANWEDEDLKIIKGSFKKVSDIYYEKLLREEDISIGIFDDKIKSHIDENYNCTEECNLGMKTINVGTDGKFYPCMQFVKNEEFVIGDCEGGIDINKRALLKQNANKESEICKTCGINKRCKHTCSCRNYITSKDINIISPIVCETERIFIELADNIAEKLHKQNSKLFIQKYYNEKYGILKKIIEMKGEK